MLYKFIFILIIIIITVHKAHLSASLPTPVQIT